MSEKIEYVTPIIKQTESTYFFHHILQVPHYDLERDFLKRWSVNWNVTFLGTKLCIISQLTHWPTGAVSKGVSILICTCNATLERIHGSLFSQKNRDMEPCTASNVCD